MGKWRGIGAGMVALLAMASVGADDPPVVPADFKLMVGEFSLKKEPVSTSEIIVRQGKAYIFESDSKEVVIVEPARKRLELLDVGRKVQAEVSFRMLDLTLEKIKTTLGEAAEAREKQGGRGNALEAKMTRDLLQKTKLAVAEDPKLHRVRLTNPTVEVDADGEPETDAARLAMVTVILESIAKLGAFKIPDDLPPFIELEAITAMTGDRKLRPTELTYLYRLKGPPKKFHRTYKLVPTLTDREVEAIARVDRLREAVPSVRYGQYRPDH
jgi:hypothetical protein